MLRTRSSLVRVLRQVSAATFSEFKFTASVLSSSFCSSLIGQLMCTYLLLPKNSADNTLSVVSEACIIISCKVFAHESLPSNHESFVSPDRGATPVPREITV